MSELQITDIDIVLDDLSHADTGGAYREVTAEITVDCTLPRERQRISLIHEMLGVYLGSVVSREDIEEMAEAIHDGLCQWEEQI